MNKRHNPTTNQASCLPCSKHSVHLSSETLLHQIHWTWWLQPHRRQGWIWRGLCFPLCSPEISSAGVDSKQSTGQFMYFLVHRLYTSFLVIICTQYIAACYTVSLIPRPSPSFSSRAWEWGYYPLLQMFTIHSCRWDFWTAQREAKTPPNPSLTSVWWYCSLHIHPKSDRNLASWCLILEPPEAQICASE